VILAERSAFVRDPMGRLSATILFDSPLWRTAMECVGVNDRFLVNDRFIGSSHVGPHGVYWSNEVTLPPRVDGKDDVPTGMSHADMKMLASGRFHWRDFTHLRARGI
jgi:hypothetical protein